MTMTKFHFTQEHVEAVNAELNRRIESAIRNHEFDTYAEAREAWKDMLQGAYSTFMVMADNWPEVVQIMDETEFDEFEF